jgi:hypothetical protein
VGEQGGKEEMTEENWLQRTIGTPDVLDRLQTAYSEEQIEAITSTEQYKDAQAALATALSLALDDTKLSRGKRRQAGKAMIDKLMTGCAAVFLLGYEQGQQETRERMADLPDSSMGTWPKDYRDAQ